MVGFFSSVAISGGPADGTAHESVFIPAKPAAAEGWGEGSVDSCALESLLRWYQCPSVWLSSDLQIGVCSGSYVKFPVCLFRPNYLGEVLEDCVCSSEEDKRIRAIWG